MNSGVFTLPTGVIGFDCNTPVSFKTAQIFRENKYSFALRYIRRDKINSYDLSSAEIRRIIDAGLLIMPVQHVESEVSWAPSALKGKQYGITAAEDCISLGLPYGITVWCDLEAVELGMPHQDVIEYCQEWYKAVFSANFIPGLYCGFHTGLTPLELYRRLSFQHYWGAGNLNKDEEPAIRGIQMKQHWIKPEDGLSKPGDIIPGVGIDYNKDTISADRLGGLPTGYGNCDWVAA